MILYFSLVLRYPSIFWWPPTIELLPEDGVSFHCLHWWWLATKILCSAGYKPFDALSDAQDLEGNSDMFYGAYLLAVATYPEVGSLTTFSPFIIILFIHG